MKIKIINIDIEVEKYNGAKNYFYDCILFNLKRLKIGDDIKLDIIFSKKIDSFKDVNPLASFSKKRGKYCLMISEKLVDALYCDEDDFVEACIVHELVHLNDYYNISKNKDIKL